MPISDVFQPYAKQVCDTLVAAGIRAELDDRNEKIGYRIREAQLQKIPYMLVLGQKEAESNTVSVRERKGGDLGAVPVEKFVEDILNVIKTKA